MQYGSHIYKETLAPTIKGDANCDGTVAIADAVAISAFVANAEKNPMTEQEMANADVHDTGNGVNASDALVIQQFATGIIESV